VGGCLHFGPVVFMAEHGWWYQSRQHILATDTRACEPHTRAGHGRLWWPEMSSKGITAGATVALQLRILKLEARVMMSRM